MPENTVYVGRPSKWGNPFALFNWQAAFRAVAMGFRGDKAGQQQAAVELYRRAVTPGMSRRTKKGHDSWWGKEVLTVRASNPLPTIDEIQNELRGKTLICWCSLDHPCHADVLLELANR